MEKEIIEPSSKTHISPSSVQQDGEKKSVSGKKEMIISALRRDLKFIPPGRHGENAMLYDPLSESYYKLTEHSCRIMQLMDHPCSLQDFLRRASDAGIECDEEELADILNFLDSNCLFVPEYGRTGKKYISHRQMMEKSRLLRAASVYLFFKLPPVYPDRFFTATAPFAKLFFNRYSVMFLVIASLCGYVLLARQWNEACSTFINSLSWAGLVNYFWALLVTKSIHELSHGYTAKVCGAKVRAMGISFIVFYPRLFVDLTDTWQLPRHQRLLCDSAGIISELIFGGLAAAVWVYASPGPLKSTMFYLFAVSTLGTILVNGNPFIRYDGYYILTDILNIENLMARSSEYLKAFNRKFFLGLGSYPDAGDCSGAALYCFGAASFIYRLFLYTSIILLLYFQFAFAKPVAIFLMIMEFFTMIFLPLWREIKLLGVYRKKISPVKTACSALLLAGIFTLFFIPFPWSMDLPCEIIAENRILVTMDEGAFASGRLSEEPFKVKKGDCILECSSPLLDFAVQKSRIITARDQAELDLVRRDSATIKESAIIYERLKANRIYQAELERRKARLSVKASSEGIFLPGLKEVVPGRWLPKGTLIGTIVSPEKKVFAYARDNEVNKLVPGDPVKIRLRDSLEEFSGKVHSINPVAVKFRDSTLVQQTGGFIACFSDRNTKEFSPVNVLYAVTIRMDSPLQCPYGRTGLAEVEKKYVLAKEMGRAMLHVFFREFSF